MTTSTPAVLLPLRSRKFDQGGTNGLHWIGCAMMIPDDTVRLSMQISGSTRSGARFGSSRSPLARSRACLCLCVRNESLLFARRRPPTTNYRLLAALTSRVRLGLLAQQVLRFCRTSDRGRLTSLAWPVEAVGGCDNEDGLGSLCAGRSCGDAKLVLAVSASRQLLAASRQGD